MSFTFPFAKTHLRLHQSGEGDAQWERLKKRVSEHHFNHAVEVLWPNGANLPPELESLELSYHTAHLPLSHFLRPNVLQKCSSLAALSLDDGIDTGNVYAILPPGKLTMSLDKDTSEELGLDSRPSRFDKYRRIVEVDLLAERFSEGKPSRERLQWCITDRLALEMDFVLCCNSSDEAQFCSYTAAEKRPCQRVTRVLEGLVLPVLHPSEPTGSLEGGEKRYSGAAEVCTWIGALSCDIESIRDETDCYVSTYTPPSPSVMAPNAVRSLWRGMIHSEHIYKILMSVRDHIVEDSWAAVCVWGFDDSPVSWKTNEHSYHVSGDNNYTVFVFGNGQYWFVPAMGTYDIVP
ncbi:hypothetical protein EMCRGX_G031032 [Ephydatia muelleri]